MGIDYNDENSPQNRDHSGTVDPNHYVLYDDLVCHTYGCDSTAKCWLLTLRFTALQDKGGGDTKIDRMNRRIANLMSALAERDLVIQRLRRENDEDRERETDMARQTQLLSEEMGSVIENKDMEISRLKANATTTMRKHQAEVNRIRSDYEAEMRGMEQQALDVSSGIEAAAAKQASDYERQLEEMKQQLLEANAAAEQKVSTMQKEVSRQLARARTDKQRELTALKNQTKKQIERVENEAQQETSALRAEADQGIATLQTEVDRQLYQTKVENETKVSALQRKLAAMQAHLNRDKEERQKDTRELRQGITLATVAHYYRERHVWLRCGRSLRQWQVHVAQDEAARRSTEIVNFIRRNSAATSALREAEAKVRERKHAMEANRQRDRWRLISQNNERQASLMARTWAKIKAAWMEYRVNVAVELAADARRAEATAKATIEEQAMESGVTLEAMHDLERLALREAERRKIAETEAKASQLQQLKHAEDALVAEQASTRAFGEKVAALTLQISVLEARLEEQREVQERLGAEKDVTESKLASCTAQFKETLAKCEAEHAQFVQGMVSAGERLAADASDKLNAAQVSKRAMEMSHEREAQATAEQIKELKTRLQIQKEDYEASSRGIKHSGISVAIAMYEWWSRRSVLSATWQRFQRAFEGSIRAELAAQLQQSRQEYAVSQSLVCEQSTEIGDLNELLTGKGDLEGQMNKSRQEVKILQKELKETQQNAEDIKLKSAQQQANLMYQLSSLVTWRQVQSLLLLRRWIEQRNREVVVRAFLDMRCNWTYHCEVDTTQYEYSKRLAVLNELRKRESTRADAKHRLDQGTKIGMFLVTLKLFTIWSSAAACRVAIMSMRTRCEKHRARKRVERDAAASTRATVYYTLGCIFSLLLGSYVEFQLGSFGSRQASPWAWLDLQLALLARGRLW